MTSVVAVKWRRADGEETCEEYGVMIKFLSLVRKRVGR